LHSRDFLKSFQPFLPWPLGIVALIFAEGKKIQPIRAEDRADWRMVEQDFPSRVLKGCSQYSHSISLFWGLKHFFNSFNSSELFPKAIEEI